MRKAAIQAIAEFPGALLSSDVAHCDIKPDNVVVGPDGSFLLCDVDSMIYVSRSGSDRVTYDEGFGSYSQFLIPTPQKPTDVEDACEMSACREADFHMGYPAVQSAFMLFSSLMSAVYIEALNTNQVNDCLWTCLIGRGCVIDMDALRVQTACFPLLFSRFCDAWTTALPLILLEKRAANIFRMPCKARPNTKRKRSAWTQSE